MLMIEQLYTFKIWESLFLSHSNNKTFFPSTRSSSRRWTPWWTRPNVDLWCSWTDSFEFVKQFVSRRWRWCCSSTRRYAGCAAGRSTTDKCYENRCWSHKRCWTRPKVSVQDVSTGKTCKHFFLSQYLWSLSLSGDLNEANKSRNGLSHHVMWLSFFN